MKEIDENNKRENKPVTDWRFKVHAYLHDPPHKPFTLGRGHEAMGRSYAESWVGPLEEGLFKRHIKPADRVASGADRDAVLGRLSKREHWVDAAKELTLVHPLDGTDLAVRRPEDRVREVTDAGRPMFTPEEVDEACELVERLFKRLSPLMKKLAKNSPQDVFLILWRFLPELLRAQAAEEEKLGFGPIWEFLPAETRMPTHPTSAHASLVSCLADLDRRGGEAAVLSFTVGPVQGFIHAARRLSDLWAGSYLLSDSLWAGLLPLVEELGPDAVFYPTLRGQALVDRWLMSQRFEGLVGSTGLAGLDGSDGSDGSDDPLLAEVFKTTREQLRRRLRIPSLPNRFVALVPRSEAARIARKCEEGVHEFWAQNVTRAAERLCLELRNKGPQGWSRARPSSMAKQAVRQVRELVEVSWAAAPWDLFAKGDLDLDKVRRPPVLRHGPSLARDELQHGEGASGYKPNGGILYGDAYAESGLLLDCVKRGRQDPQKPATSVEKGLKCSLCGEREVLSPREGHFWEARRLWASTDPPKGSWFRKGEALCGVCWAKRYWGVEGAKRHLDPEGSENTPLRHPSTGEVAASPFKKRLVEALKQKHAESNGSVGGLCSRIAEFNQAIQECEQVGSLDRGDTHVWSVEALEEIMARFGASRDKLLGPLARTDGMHLMAHPRREGEGEGRGDGEGAGLASLEPEGGLAKASASSDISPSRRGLLEAAEKLRRYASRELNLAPPRPYLAVVHLDGDKLGTWLSGQHPRTPSFMDMFHPKLHEPLKGLLDASALHRPRRVTPAVHAALSGACAAFSGVAAPLTVEGEGLCGHLVYAGGDDALLLAPAEEVVELVRRLRLRLSGYPWPFDAESDYAVQEGAPIDPQDPLHLRAQKRPFQHHRGYVVCKRTHKGMPRLGSGRDSRELHLVFGGRVTASAGICVFHYTWPLSDAIHRATQAEAFAKETLGRDAVGFSVLRRSGSVTQTGLSFTGRVTESPQKGASEQDAPHGAEDFLKTFQRLVDAFRTGLSPTVAKVLAAEVELLHLEALSEAQGLSQRERRRHGENAWKMALSLSKRALRRRKGLLGPSSSESDPSASSPLTVAKVEAWLQALAGACGAPRSGAVGVRRWIDLLDTAAFMARGGEV